MQAGNMRILEILVSFGSEVEPKRVAYNPICLLQETIDSIQCDTFSCFRRISFPQELIESDSDIHGRYSELVQDEGFR
jgi:hypothetical protein